MNTQIKKLSMAGRQAAQANDWPKVRACAREILSRARDSAEGYFLLGIAESAGHRREAAEKAFIRAINVDEGRYDAAIELAAQYMKTHRYGQAVDLVQKHASLMGNSPKYLDMAGTICVNAGQPQIAWPLYERANELQPGVQSIMANFAACSVYVGKITEAKDIYRELLRQSPAHQRNHYELSRLETAEDSVHIDSMKSVIQSTKLPAEKNIYLYYALGKELEDLERWDEAFDYYRLAGNAAASISNYDVEDDVGLIDKMIEVCNREWLLKDPLAEPSTSEGKVPVFVVGLPRTGTTLTERIVSSHSAVESVGESYFMQIAVKQVSRIDSPDNMTPAMLESAAGKDINRIAKAYIEAIRYRFGDKPLFIEKFPENFLYLGFIAKAFPNAKIIHLNRNPMDSCFALYKQSYFRYAYLLDDVGRYYAAYDRLCNHWRGLLGNRLIEVNYEDVVGDQERETRRILAALGLEFETACLNFERNVSASNTASTVQIRQKVHGRSVERWKCFEKQLQSLKDYLESAGVDVA